MKFSLGRLHAAEEGRLTSRRRLGTVFLHRLVRVEVVERSVGFRASRVVAVVQPLDLVESPPRTLCRLSRLRHKVVRFARASRGPPSRRVCRDGPDGRIARCRSRQRIGESGEVSSRVRRIEDGSSGIECARRRAERTGCDELRRTDRDSRSCRGRRCVKEGRRTARTASVGARERGTRVERISCGSGSILRRGNTMRVVTVLKICPVMERVVDCRGLLRSVKCRGRGRVAGRVVKVART